MSTTKPAVTAYGAKRRVLLVALIFLSGGCTNPAMIWYGDRPPDIEKTLSRGIQFLDLYSHERVVNHIKDIKSKLISPFPLTGKGDPTLVHGAYLCLLRFKADPEVHLRGGERTKPSSKVVSLLAQSFAENAGELAEPRDLEAEHVVPYESNLLGLITRDEDQWLLFNKKTGTYFLYTNSDPTSQECVKERQAQVDAKPW